MYLGRGIDQVYKYDTIVVTRKTVTMRLALRGMRLGQRQGLCFHMEGRL